VVVIVDVTIVPFALVANALLTAIESTGQALKFAGIDDGVKTVCHMSNTVGLTPELKAEPKFLIHIAPVENPINSVLTA
jgi:hypothetical protein